MRWRGSCLCWKHVLRLGPRVASEAILYSNTSKSDWRPWPNSSGAARTACMMSSPGHAVQVVLKRWRLTKLINRLQVVCIILIWMMLPEAAGLSFSSRQMNRVSFWHRATICVSKEWTKSPCFGAYACLCQKSRPVRLTCPEEQASWSYHRAIQNNSSRTHWLHWERWQVLVCLTGTCRVLARNIIATSTTRSRCRRQ